jgi:flagellar motor switch protein FliG
MQVINEKGKDYKKVAKLLVALGPEFSKEILGFLEEAEVKKVIDEVIEIGELSPEERNSIINEFTLSMIKSEEKSSGGFAVAREILLTLYDQKKVDELMGILRPDEGPLKFIEEIPAEKVYEAIKNESSQVIAVILAFISEEKASIILSYMDKDKAVDVTTRMAAIEKTEPDHEMISDIISILREKLVQKHKVRINGFEKAVKVLQQIDKKVQKEIIDQLEKQTPELANRIKKELFRFEDLKNIEDRYMQRILREIESKDLVVALKGVSDELKNKVFKNMSERGAEMIKDDMESLGPIKRQIVEDSQQKILTVIRKLEASGEIVLAGGSADVVL